MRAAGMKGFSERRGITLLLMGLITAITLAVLVANFFTVGQSKDLATWGNVAVLGVLVALFKTVATAATKDQNVHTITVTSDDIDLSTIRWNQDECLLKARDGKSMQEFPIQLALSPVYPACDINIDREVYSQLTSGHVMELRLVDDAGRVWSVPPFRMHRTSCALQAPDEFSGRNDFEETYD
jgi:hypothetical protein